jgi:mRNA-degrading endonuclease RelE of RelBE toxin-antitoxin system
MIVEETVQYARTKKKLLKKHILSEKEIEKTLLFFQEDTSEPSLHYKKMTCKKDKNRYSIRILNSAYRILMTVIDDKAFLVCICDHDDYDYRNKNC